MQPPLTETSTSLATVTTDTRASKTMLKICYFLVSNDTRLENTWNLQTKFYNINISLFNALSILYLVHLIRIQKILFFSHQFGAFSPKYVLLILFLSFRFLKDLLRGHVDLGGFEADFVSTWHFKCFRVLFMNWFFQKKFFFYPAEPVEPVFLELQRQSARKSSEL